MHLALNADNHLEIFGRAEQPQLAGVASRDKVDADPLADWISSWQAEARELDLRLDEATSTLWCGFVHPERPCFSPALLGDIKRFQRRLEREARKAQADLRTLVWQSSFPDVWNLGGDLALFVRLIAAGDREALRRYAHACCETVHTNWTKRGGNWRTIALIEGDALGGGFEAAITNDVIIAEEHSKFGLPEILFKMFPGMGAYSFLSRRIGGARAEALITSGRLYGAEEMHEMGIVDLVVPTGAGRDAVEEWIRRERRRHRVTAALDAVKRRCQPVTYDELIDVTEIWVDTAMALTSVDLRKMERLAAAQDRRRARDVSRAAA